ncbi:MAG TPA: hypothetical protein VGS11_00590 [Candidatus Bathyarchaeia archaeon]|nr:hypothetical protein [Candidatus Bathyarchaeia archaeon]
MRLGKRTQAGLSLVLGVLIGLAFVVLPGILAPSTQTSVTHGSNGSNYGTFGPAQATQPGTLGNQPNASSVGSIVGSILILVSLILFPAIALSFLARHWVLKQAKERLGSND